jgi:hypothetical protein
MSAINIFFMGTFLTALIAGVAGAWVGHRRFGACIPALLVWVAYMPLFFLPDSVSKTQRTMLSLIVLLVVWSIYFLIAGRVKSPRKAAAS